MQNLAGLMLPNAPFLPYLLVGVASVLEGPITLMATGAMISSGYLLPLPAFLSVTIGNLIADMGWYRVGRLGKLEWLSKVFPKLRIDQSKVDQLGLDIQRNAPRLVFFSKLTLGLPVPTLVAVGLNRVPVKRWLALLILGELIKSGTLVAVGYLYAKAIQQASGSIQVVLWGITIVFVAGFAIWFKHMKNQTLNNEHQNQVK